LSKSTIKHDLLGGEEKKPEGVKVETFKTTGVMMEDNAEAASFQAAFNANGGCPTNKKKWNAPLASTLKAGGGGGQREREIGKERERERERNASGANMQIISSGIPYEYIEKSLHT
jgi:hypothetical protein